MRRAAARAARRWFCSCAARSERCAARDKRRVLSSTQRLDPLPDDPVIGNGTFTEYAVALKELLQESYFHIDNFIGSWQPRSSLATLDHGNYVLLMCHAVNNPGPYRDAIGWLARAPTRTAHGTQSGQPPDLVVQRRGGLRLTRLPPPPSASSIGGEPAMFTEYY